MNRITRTIYIFVFLLACVSVPLSASWADKITLTNGGVLEGVISKENEKEIVLLSRVGELTLARNSIAKIEKGNSYQLYLDRGNMSANKGDFPAAKENYARASRAGCPQDILKAHLENLAKAETLERSAKIEKKIDEASKQRTAGMLSSAIKTMMSLSPNDKTDVRVRRLLSEMLSSYAYDLIDHLRYNEAVEQMILARDFGASKAELHFLMGLLKKGEGRVALAQYEFEEALQEDPNVYAKFPGGISIPLFPVPVEAKAQVAQSETDGLQVAKVNIGIDQQRALKPPPADAKPAAQVPELPAIQIDSSKQAVLAYIKRYSGTYQIDPLLVEAVARVESGLNAAARSPAGALGVMQLMPLTAKDLGVKDPMNADENVRGGAKYLSMMLGEFKDTKLALAAYNAGPSTVRFYQGIPPYPETRIYVPRVLREFDRLREKEKVGLGGKK